MSTPDNRPPQSRQMAVALAYRSGDTAPKVVASGRGLIAQAIIERAKEHGVFVHESEELVGMLMQVELDQHIPPQLYLAVAELLAWLYRMEKGENGAIPRNAAVTNPLQSPQLKPR
ncbi:MAG TPA: EscU/YscU/HrcU family type III secretion system export apparatus switch protein [Sideroxyarcus sp.]|nr:EscU/YscU/HrcU family type III secretion system export apparatus switch protein [Sideroxyarcus sp.]